MQATTNESGDNEEAISSPARPVMNGRSQQFQGILYKRRDVMKRQWRPRLFVLNYDLCVLSYYLLNDEYGSITGSTDMMDSKNDASNFNYDVVPRGSISLRGCIVETRDDVRLERKEKLFRFSITPVGSASGGETAAHLAAASPDQREEWVQRIAQVCCRSYSVPEQEAPISSFPIPLRSPDTRNEDQRNLFHDEESSSSISTTPSLTEHELAIDRRKEKFHLRPGTKETKITYMNLPSTILEGDCNEDEGESAQFYENVSIDLAQQIDSTIKNFLPLCLIDSNTTSNQSTTQNEHNGSDRIDQPSNLEIPCDNEEASNNCTANLSSEKWRFLLENKGVTVHDRLLPQVDDDGTGATTLLKSDAILPDHSPINVFELIIDPTQRPKYEANIHTAHRLEVLNDFTFCDYYTYKASWPTQTRDFCVVTHWRVIKKMSKDGAENPIVLFLAFSWDKTNLFPLQKDCVRAKCIVNMYTLQQSTISQQGTNNEGSALKVQYGCRITRLLCADLGGSIHSSMSNAVLQQNALVPISINDYLSPLKRSQDIRGEIEKTKIMSNQFICDHIIEPRKKIWKEKLSEINYVRNSQMRYLFSTDTIGDSEQNAEREKMTDERCELSDTIEISSSKTRDSRQDMTASLDSMTNNDRVIHNDEENMLMKIPLFICPFLLGHFAASISTWYSTNDDRNLPGWHLLVPKIFILFIFIGAIHTSIEKLIQISSTTPDNFHSTIRAPSLPMITLILVFVIPFLAHYTSGLILPLRFVKQVTFIFTFLSILRSIVRKSLGVHIKHTAVKTGPVTCSFTVDLKGVLRFIELRREEIMENPLLSKENGYVPRREISVTHIVVKAISCAIVEIPVLNSHTISIPMLGIHDEVYAKSKCIAVSVASNLYAVNSTLLQNVSKMTIQEIACDLWMAPINSAPKEHQSGNFFSDFFSWAIALFHVQSMGNVYRKACALVITSPDSENSEIDIDVMPCKKTGEPNITIVIGGMRVRRDDLGKARPLLSMSVSIDSPVCNVGMSRKFAEALQMFIQFPELCENA